MKAWAWSIPGLFLPLLLPGIPGNFALLVLLFALVLIGLRQSPCVVFLLLGAAWTGFQIQERLDERVLEPPASPLIVNGKVNSLPIQRGGMLEFRFQIDNAEYPHGLSGQQLIVRWYRNFPEVSAGEEWQLGLRIKPARGRVNFQGPDRERWYFAQGIAALGVVQKPGTRKSGPANYWNMAYQRQRSRDAITRVVDDHPSRPLILALALADRSEIPNQAWQRFRLTGTSHLLAISGMHIGLAAVIGYWLGRVILCFLPATFLLRFGKQTALFSSVTVAVLYALMAGLSTSTQRALIMLLVFVLLKVTQRSSRIWMGLLLALFLVLVVNPLAPLETGFWFSFIAVAILLATFSPRTGTRHWLRTLLLAQVSVTVVMLPLGMLFFQKVTFLGLVSNLAAIPWVSFTVVPAILLGMLTLPLGDPVAPFLLLIAAESLRYLDAVLRLIELWGAGTWMTVSKPAAVPVMLASLGALLLMTPGKMYLRHLGAILLIPVLLPHQRQREQLEIEMLDVGQGLAIVVRTTDRQLLYDTGPGDARSWSLASSAIIPALGARAPDLLLVSHGDLDHAGGMFDLRRQYPESEVLASLRASPEGVSPCDSSRSWSWDGVRFDVLHPSSGLPYLGNDSSCVLSIEYGDVNLLLTGDISSSIEKRLVLYGTNEHDVLFAPHHGSKSSSSREFIEAISPEVAMVSTGFQNSFNFPNPTVQARYRAQKIPLLNTAVCGAIQLTVSKQGEILISSARRVNSAVWRWPADTECP
jgi:competence protein ComEC